MRRVFPKKTYAALVALGLASGFISSANASVIYDINIDSCGSGCGLSSYGTVTVTQVLPTQLQVVIALASNVFFNQAGRGLDSVAFDLIGNPAITISGLPSNFGVNGAQNAGSHHENGLGDWDYIVDWVGPPTNNGNLPAGGVSGLAFSITSLLPLMLDTTASHNANVYFSIDISRGAQGPTGVVGATLTTVVESVSEPSTLLLLGAAVLALLALGRMRLRPH